jgi:isoleucyl-tRNA synthetase
MEEIIREELNVKNVIFRDNEEDLVEYEARANFRILGKELGKNMKAAAEKIAAFSQSEIQSLLEGAVFSIELDADGAESGQRVDITGEKIEIRRLEKANLKVINEGTLTVGLDTEINLELSMEGDVRDLVRGVQNLRKDSNLEVTNRIVLCLYGSDKLKASWEAFSDYIASETLSVKTIWENSEPMTEIEAGDEKWKVKIEKAE